MASTEPDRCAYCGAPAKNGRACGSHADLEKALRELHGDEPTPRGPLAGSAESRQDDAPTDPPGGAA